MADPSFYYNRIGELSYEGFLEFSPSSIEKRRWKVFAAKGTRCVSCGIEGTKVVLWMDRGGRIHADLASTGPIREIMITLDHHIPKSKGGPNTVENLNPMCYPCNQHKKDTHPYER